jgi:superfamily II DNA/RNA helicase
MFDAQTAALLRSAPAVPGFDPDLLPAFLTYQYANLASYRLGGLDSASDEQGDEWTLERLADTYELTAALQIEPQMSRASAFVAATAQQIIARREKADPDTAIFPNIDQHRLDPALSAVLLFLLAEQFADANEATAAINLDTDIQTYEATILTEHIIDLGKGRLHEIVRRSERWRVPRKFQDLEEKALAALFESLATGIELFAADFLKLNAPETVSGRYDNPRQAFERVISLSATKKTVSGPLETIDFVFAGPHHLASLLLSATDGISAASLMEIPPPTGADEKTWIDWLRFRSEKFPYMWSNHREAVDREFHQTGVSGVVVLPTGAGKTTVSSLKIAGALARGKKVVFLAPTHALVEQLTEDLQEMFPKELLGSVVSSDFDLLLQEDATFQDVEVMTPERCLAMLSFASEAFQDVGLLVFDECHLLSPESGKIRRALDGMLCVLGFNNVAPDADILFLSAMVKNGDELAVWLAELTGRPGLSVDLIWKPSRQARGVVIFDSQELETARVNAVSAQEAEDVRLDKTATTLRKKAKEKLTAQPYAIWGLQHNWISEDNLYCSTTPLLADSVFLAGKLEYGPSVRLTPNANGVAASIAAAGAAKGLKTIIFVNTKNDAVTVADNVTKLLNEPVEPTDYEAFRWKALELELGDLKHSLLPGPAAAVPHNSAMLRLERDLAERMFKRSDGAKVIVATPTLAQGLNLPAHLAILAGDKRAGAEGGRESLEAHEILNAAARAGRAGHLANGLVLLVPEPIMKFTQKNKVSKATQQKLKAVLPEDDHCVTITDPLQIVLDRVNVGQATDPEVTYTINRFANLPSEDASIATDQIFDLKKSFAAHIAQKKESNETFDQKVAAFRAAVEERHQGGTDETSAILASQSGLSSEVVVRLKERITETIGSLPTSIPSWVEWMTEWLIEDDEARAELLADTQSAMLAVAGKTKTAPLDKQVMRHVLGGSLAWIAGKPLAEIETTLGGEPQADAITKRTCPRARSLASAVIPRGYSFVLGLIAHVAKEVDPFEAQDDLDQQMTECMSTALRLGYDTTEKLFFARDEKDALGRVQAHMMWDAANQ